jgi:hypothetical protein
MATKREKLRSKRTQPTADWAFLTIGGLVILAAAGLIALGWPLLRQAAHAQANRLVAEGKRVGGQEALLNYQLAGLLEPGNPAAALAVAQLEASGGHYNQALRSLEAAGEGIEAVRLRLRLQIELASLGIANSAGRLAAVATTDDDRLLVAMGYLVAGRPQDVPAVTAAMSAPKPLQRVQRASSSVTALGAELYAMQLVRASGRLLMKQPSSLTRDILLGHMAAAKRTPAAYAQARGYFEAALQHDITNTEARTGLIAALEALGNNQAAIQQIKLNGRLQTGRP